MVGFISFSFFLTKAKFAQFSQRPTLSLAEDSINLTLKAVNFLFISLFLRIFSVARNDAADTTTFNVFLGCVSKYCQAVLYILYVFVSVEPEHGISV